MLVFVHAIVLEGNDVFIPIHLPSTNSRVCGDVGMIHSTFRKLEMEEGGRKRGIYYPPHSKVKPKSKEDHRCRMGMELEGGFPTSRHEQPVRMIEASNSGSEA